MLCESSKDLSSLHGKLGVIICAESALPIGKDLDKLRYMYKLGLRILCPAWEGMNSCCGSFDTYGGFTSFGRQIICECEKLGIIIDVSHLSQRAFYELCTFAKKPFIASHSCNGTVYPHMRNLNSKQTKEIVKRGGIIGVSLVKKHLSPLLESHCTKELALKAYRKHITEFINNYSDCNLATGFDFDGTECILGLDKTYCAKDIFKYLYKNGLNKYQLNKIFYNNAFTFFTNML